MVGQMDILKLPTVKKMNLSTDMRKFLSDKSVNDDLKRFVKAVKDRSEIDEVDLNSLITVSKGDNIDQDEMKAVLGSLGIMKDKKIKATKPSLAEIVEQVKDIVSVPVASAVVKKARKPRVKKESVVKVPKVKKEKVAKVPKVKVAKVPKVKKEKVAKVPKVKVAKVPKVKKEKVAKVPKVKKEKVLKVPKVPKMLKLALPALPAPSVFLPPMNVDKKELDVPIKNKVLKPRAKKEEFVSKLAPVAPKSMQPVIVDGGKFKGKMIVPSAGQNINQAAFERKGSGGSVPVKRVLDEVYTGKGKTGFSLVDGKTLLKAGIELREFRKNVK